MVIVSNQVSSGKERLGQIGGELVQAEQQAAALKPYDDFAKSTIARRDAVTKVAKARFDWDRTLIELSRVAPGDVWLTSAKGTISPSTSVDGGATGSSLRGAMPGPALELAGCGKRDSDVPKYMDRLYTMTGATEVGFDRTERASSGTTTPRDRHDRRRLRRAAKRRVVLARDVLQAEPRARRARSGVRNAGRSHCQRSRRGCHTSGHHTTGACHPGRCHARRRHEMIARRPPISA